MSNSEHSAISKLFLDDSLNDLIIFHVDIGSGFINEDDLALFEEGSTDT